MSNFPGVGEKIPDIAMTATDGGVVKPSDFAGRRLVFFYPKDDTPGCTTENIDFSALAGEFAAAGVALLGVSKDLPAKHAKFIAKHNLTALCVGRSRGRLVRRAGHLDRKGQLRADLYGHGAHDVAGRGGRCDRTHLEQG
jgi:peroxiredoxin